MVELHGRDPQEAGRQLNRLLYDLLRAERLSPEGTFCNPGEEIDGAFVVDGQHYLMECKWETDRVGVPAVRKLKEIVSTKPEGTFGVFLSISGYVANVDQKLTWTARLNSVGLSVKHLLNVLEGRATWSSVVRSARQVAARRSTFLYTG